MHKTMKKLALALSMALASVGVRAADTALDNFLALRAPAGSPVELGVWNGDLDACKAAADKYGIPMIAIWSREGCAHCAILEKAMTAPVFIEWTKTCGMILCFTCSRDPLGVRQGPENGNGKYYWFCKRPNLISDYPFVRFYWYQKGKKVVDYSVHGDKLDRQQGIGIDKTYNKAGQYVIDYIMQTSGFGAYAPHGLSAYTGGNFDFTETDTDRLEAEAGTSEITFNLVRDASAAESATSNTVKVVAPGGKTVETVNVTWKAGETNKTVTVNAAKMGFTAAGQKASLITVSAEGEEQATNHVTYVEAANSVANPLWIGERSAGSGVHQSGSARPLGLAVRALEAGEWTMDLDVALARTAAQEGDAYTLLMFTGALWCPWCRGIDNYVLESDEFKALAKEKNIALVTLDNPRRGGYDSFAAGTTNKTISAGPCGAAPTLLRTANGKAGNGTASGRGYISRKGVTAEKAEEILQRNHDLGYAGGAYATPGAYRTGYPTFVLLDKEGNIVGRWKTTSSSEQDSEARYTYDAAQNVAMLADLIANASAEREQNRYAASTAVKLAVGQDGTAEFSANAPAQAFRLSNVPSGKVSFYVKTNDTDKVPVLSLQKLETSKVARLDAAGAKVSETDVTTAVQYGETGEGSLVCEFTAEEAKGEYALLATFDGITPGTKPFEITIGSSPVLVPGQEKAEFTPVSGQVSIEVEKGETYKLSGAWLDLPTSFTNVMNDLWTANETYRAVMAVTPGEKIAFQIWRPGTAGFTVDRENTTEDSGTFQVSIGRSGGASGAVSLKVSLDENATDYYDSDKKPKFEFKETTLEWAEGETGSKIVEIILLDDERFDGDGTVALKLEYAEGSAQDTVIENASYSLTVAENDKRSPGRAMFSGAEPFFAKSKTVYVREGEPATIYVDRIEATDGAVSAKVTASNSAILGGAVASNIVSWANHNGDPQAITVSGVAAGKTAKITLSSPTDGLKILSASNSVTVAAVAADAPAFESETGAISAYRYVACSNTFPVVLAEGVEGARLTFSKISGTLPAGLKAGYDAAAGALAIFGSPTAKPGEYTAVYQVTQQVGSKRTPGLAIELKITVADYAAETEGATPNPVFAGKSTLTFKDMPVLHPTEIRLAGTLQLVLKANGALSAKYACAAGSVSFSSRNWSEFDAETGALKAALTTTKRGGYALSVTCAADGSATAIITDPAFDTDLEAETDGNIWSKDNSAADWQGYYTATMPFAGIIDEGVEGVAPRGAGYLTLKMNTSSAWNAGKVTWAGMLPNGQTVSGTTILTKGDCWAYLPLFKTSSKDEFSALLKINANAIDSKENENKCQAVFEAEEAKGYWRHTEKATEASFGIELDVYGGIYDPKENLAEACQYYYETTAPAFTVDTKALGGWTSFGEPGAVEGVTLTVTDASGARAITVASGQANPQKFTLSLNRSTGIASGRFNIPYIDAKGAAKTLSATWKGVVLVGWGPGCGCGDGPEAEVELPFVNGAYWFTDKVQSGKSTVSVKRGGALGAE